MLTLTVCNSPRVVQLSMQALPGSSPGCPGHLDRSARAARAARHDQRGAATRPSRRSGLSSETDSGLSGVLRRRRNEQEYPHLPADTATLEEAGTAQRLTNRGRGQVAVSTVLLRPRPRVMGPRQETADGIVPAMLAAFAAPPRPSHRKLFLPEKAGLSRTECEPRTFPGAGKPVTNKVTTHPDNIRPSEVNIQALEPGVAVSDRRLRFSGGCGVAVVAVRDFRDDCGL